MPASVIYKYPIPLKQDSKVLMPEGAELLKLDQDPDGVICAWCVVDPDAPKISYTFHAYDTGRPFYAEGKTYVNSVNQGPYAWHFFTS